MQPAAQRIFESLGDPKALEALYRQDTESFRDSFDEVFRAAHGDRVGPRSYLCAPLLDDDRHLPGGRVPQWTEPVRGSFISHHLQRSSARCAGNDGLLDCRARGAD